MKGEVWLLVLCWGALAGSGRALAFAPIAIERRYIVQQCASIISCGRRGKCILSSIRSSADPSSNDLGLYKKPPSTFFAAGVMRD
jgi:hypothetical protein